MKATKLNSGNYHVLVYCGKDSSGKEIRKSFTGPDKAKVLADNCTGGRFEAGLPSTNDGFRQ